ncbi:UvrD-helicase domain-containing protein [Nocardia sp. NPDC059091]|uniref:UvrD-helicase domain-containing protein n=1 Tax=Nocardia sp. NPDC059091 TaxID=3346724 RepID=UPI003686549C
MSTFGADYPPAQPNHSTLSITDDRHLWSPIGIDDLEPAAWEALRATTSSAVIAGPGAGKTEFLAQRAAYLLQTGLCPPPRRILAISFKRDAAANLGKRVRDRLGELGNRFESMTFDAFAKSLVDRFGATLPQPWALHGDYQLNYFTVTQQRDFVHTLATTTPELSLRTGLFRLPHARFLTEILGSYPLPEHLPANTDTARDYAVLSWWREHYLREGTQVVDFTMLNRLAELLVRTTAHIRRGLTATYPYVFIDEFQDTTFAQYSFLKSVFGGRPVVTVVGDRKQRIMGWAGALEDAFAEFSTDFAAPLFRLTWNHRSTAALAALQHAVAVRLDPDSAPAVSKAAVDVVGDPIQIWTFPSLDREAQIVAEWIAEDTAESKRSPGRYVLVARQQVAEFEQRFRMALARYGIRLRNDAAKVIGELTVQDLLKNPIAQLVIGILQLATASGQPILWTEICNQVLRVHGVGGGEEMAGRAVIDELSAFIATLRSWLYSNEPTASNADRVVARISEFLGVDRVHRQLAAHQQSAEVQELLDAVSCRLGPSAESGGSWDAAVREYQATDAVGLMTVHKSKSLEYHTVFFVGLDNAQWWSHTKEPEDSTATFFVGLSRAAQRTIFTSCTERGPRTDLEDLYAVLRRAAVPEIEWQ